MTLPYSPDALVTYDLNGDGTPDYLFVGNTNVTETFTTFSAVSMTNTFSLTNPNNVIDGFFAGDGSGLVNLSAGQLTGTVPDARLSANVPLLNANQSFTGVNTFGNSGNSFSGTFNGTGSGLTGLNASQLSGGIIPLARLNPAVVTNNASSVSLSGTFSGNGSGLTNLNASQLTSGFVPSGALTSVPAANLTGIVPLAVLASVVETNGGALKVGANGTTFTQIEAGQTPVATSSTTETNFLINYTQPFSSPPKVVATIAFGIQGVSDVYAINVSSNSTTAFRVNVMRLDAPGGWGQTLLINWQAWQ